MGENPKKKNILMEMKEIEKLKEIEKELTPFKIKNEFRPSVGLIKKTSSITSKSINPKILPKIGHDTIPGLTHSPVKK